MKKIKLLKKKRDSKSFQWLSRHVNDEYFIKSKYEGYRSRAAFKLIQIDDKFKFLKNSCYILDFGCSPGGWLQVAKKRSPNHSKILGIDKLKLKEILGVDFICDDIHNPNLENKINNYFSNKKLDLILSDMSPNSSGNKKVDHLRIISIIETVIQYAQKFLKKDGYLISKIFQGGAQGELVDEMSKNFYNIKYFKPKASRKESPETYLITKKKE